MIKNPFNKAVVLLLGLFLLNCEPDADRLGEQFFPKIKLEETNYDIIGYNINNNDTLRADNLELGNAMLGAFKENVFGGQKASFVSQVRLESYAPDFGVNPVIDSAVLVLKPLYDEQKPNVSEDGDYVYPDGNINAKKKTTSYPVFKYGKEDKPMTINVQEVTEFLGSTATVSYSDKVVGVNPDVIGTKIFKGRINEVSITKDEDNSSLFSYQPSLRIPLDKNFIQTKILDKKGTKELSDAATFVRYFKGIRISVAEDDGYLMSFDPNTTQIVVYYKNDKVENGNTTKVRQSFIMNLGAGNTRFGQYNYDRAGSSVVTALANGNATTGDEKLFLQGMGGPSIGIKIPATTISNLRKKYRDDKAAIMGATIRIFVDDIWNNDYALPNKFVFLQKEKKAFLPEMTIFSAVSNYRMIKFKDENAKFYDITVTETLKNIIEKNEANDDFILHIGDWRWNYSANSYYGYQYDSRAYSPYRTVLVGTKAGHEKRIQLKVTYGTN